MALLLYPFIKKTILKALCVCVFCEFVPRAKIGYHGGQRMAGDSLGLELDIAMSYHVEPENLTWFPYRAASALNS